MNRQIVAVILQEGGKFITELIKTRSFKRVTIVEPQPVMVGEYQEIAEADKASSIEAGCVPCSLGHLGTCSGLLSESMRFARKDGLDSTEVIDRIGLCTDEISALERIDLRPQLIANLPPWEKDLANRVLVESRNIRHGLENITTVDELEKVAAQTQSVRQEIGRAWFKHRLSHMSETEKTKAGRRALEKLEED